MYAYPSGLEKGSECRHGHHTGFCCDDFLLLLYTMHSLSGHVHTHRNQQPAHSQSLAGRPGSIQSCDGLNLEPRHRLCTIESAMILSTGRSPGLHSVALPVVPSACSSTACSKLAHNRNDRHALHAPHQLPGPPVGPSCAASTTTHPTNRQPKCRRRQLLTVWCQFSNSKQQAGQT
jgi:hypothetical protein